MDQSNCHKVAAFDTYDQSTLASDDQLFAALVSGCHVEAASRIAGISERTVYRRLAEPEFRRRLDSARENLRESILAKLSDAGLDAVSTLWDLMGSSQDDAVRLKAAKSILDSLLGFHQRSPRTQSVIRTTIEQTRVE